MSGDHAVSAGSTPPGVAHEAKTPSNPDQENQQGTLEVQKGLVPPRSASVYTQQQQQQQHQQQQPPQPQQPPVQAPSQPTRQHRRQQSTPLSATAQQASSLAQESRPERQRRLSSGSASASSSATLQRGQPQQQHQHQHQQQLPSQVPPLQHLPPQLLLSPPQQLPPPGPQVPWSRAWSNASADTVSSVGFNSIGAAQPSPPSLMAFHTGGVGAQSNVSVAGPATANANASAALAGVAGGIGIGVMAALGVAPLQLPPQMPSLTGDLPTVKIFPGVLGRPIVAKRKGRFSVLGPDDGSSGPSIVITKPGSVVHAAIAPPVTAGDVPRQAEFNAVCAGEGSGVGNVRGVGIGGVGVGVGGAGVGVGPGATMDGAPPAPAALPPRPPTQPQHNPQAQMMASTLPLPPGVVLRGRAASVSGTGPAAGASVTQPSTPGTTVTAPAVGAGGINAPTGPAAASGGAAAAAAASGLQTPSLPPGTKRKGRFTLLPPDEASVSVGGWSTSVPPSMSAGTGTAPVTGEGKIPTRAPQQSAQTPAHQPHLVVQTPMQAQPQQSTQLQAQQQFLHSQQIHLPQQAQHQMTVQQQQQQQHQVQQQSMMQQQRMPPQHQVQQQIQSHQQPMMQQQPMQPHQQTHSHHQPLMQQQPMQPQHQVQQQNQSHQLSVMQQQAQSHQQPMMQQQPMQPQHKVQQQNQSHQQSMMQQQPMQPQQQNQSLQQSMMQQQPMKPQHQVQQQNQSHQQSVSQQKPMQQQQQVQQQNQSHQQPMMQQQAQTHQQPMIQQQPMVHHQPMQPTQQHVQQPRQPHQQPMMHQQSMMHQQPAQPTQQQVQQPLSTMVQHPSMIAQPQQQPISAAQVPHHILMTGLGSAQAGVVAGGFGVGVGAPHGVASVPLVGGAGAVGTGTGVRSGAGGGGGGGGGSGGDQRSLQVGGPLPARTAVTGTGTGTGTGAGLPSAAGPAVAPATRSAAFAPLLDGKGVGVAAAGGGLGKVLYFLDQMRHEVVEADRMIKSLQKDVRFLRDKNKELETRKNEFERRYQEEKALREVADGKVRSLKKKVKELKEALSSPCESVSPAGVIGDGAAAAAAVGEKTEATASANDPQNGSTAAQPREETNELLLDDTNCGDTPFDGTKLASVCLKSSLNPRATSQNSGTTSPFLSYASMGAPAFDQPQPCARIAPLAAKNSEAAPPAQHRESSVPKEGIISTIPVPTIGSSSSAPPSGDNGVRSQLQVTMDRNESRMASSGQAHLKAEAANGLSIQSRINPMDMSISPSRAQFPIATKTGAMSVPGFDSRSVLENENLANAATRSVPSSNILGPGTSNPMATSDSVPNFTTISGSPNRQMPPRGEQCLGQNQNFKSNTAMSSCPPQQVVSSNGSQERTDPFEELACRLVLASNKSMPHSTQGV